MMATTWVDVGEHRVAVDRGGTNHGGELPAVLLHGMPGFRGHMHTLAERLGRDRPVIAPDLLGFGDSSALRAGGHADAQADMVLGLFDALGLHRVLLLGHDFGGPVAMRVVARAPHRVAALGLAATNLFTDTPVPAPLRIVRVPALGEGFVRLAFGRWGVAALWRAAVADRAAFPFARYREVLEFGGGLATTRRLFVESLRDLPGLYGAVEASLATVAVPTVVLWGDRDPFFDVAVGERIARAIPGARLVVLPECGHFVPEERPEETARELTALCDRA